MKKLFVLFMVLLLVFAYGCSQTVVVEQPPVTEPEAPEEVVEEVEPVEEVVEEPKEESLIVEDEDDSGYDWDAIPKAEQRKIEQIRKAMDKAVANGDNYFYRYTGPDQYQYEYWVLDDNFKIQVLEEDQLDKTTIKNMVYLDRSTGDAEWYCEHSNMNFCYSGEGPWPASYDEFYSMTPLEWLESLGKDFRYRFDDRVNGVTNSIIDYETDDGLVRVWIDTWMGYPRLIEYHYDMDPEGEADESYLFDDMDYGNLKEGDVTP